MKTNINKLIIAPKFKKIIVVLTLLLTILIGNLGFKVYTIEKEKSRVIQVQNEINAQIKLVKDKENARLEAIEIVKDQKQNDTMIFLHDNN